jgi:hypothetical protein
VVIQGRPSTRVYNNYYYYPRDHYPYGYGSYGLGYFYYDPYSWYDPYVYSNYSYPSYSSLLTCNLINSAIQYERNPA